MTARWWCSGGTRRPERSPSRGCTATASATSRASGARNPDLRLASKRVGVQLGAIEVKAARLERIGRISPGCLDAVTQGVAVLADAVEEMLRHTGLCVP